MEGSNSRMNGMTDYAPFAHLFVYFIHQLGFEAQGTDCVCDKKGYLCVETVSQCVFTNVRESAHIHTTLNVHTARFTMIGDFVAYIGET